ncbi:protein gamma response 1-like [Bidens hawaiensis]|uniref:protein gamma response 1-like n=1 Tax=Bidens hawaiensis TaxID=980011 RepID=UPI00404AF1BD
MEGDSEHTYHIDGTDTEYISGLSTLLAATIQETKESVSQIEYLFCKQLFPDFQSKLKKIYSETKKASEDEWKKKETDLMLQLKTLESEKQKLFEENHFLKTENSKMKKIPNDLEEELKRKSKEIAEKRELQKSLRELLDSKGNMVNVNEKRMKELEEENKDLKLNLESKCRIIEEKEESNCELRELIRSKNALNHQKDDELADLSEKLLVLENKLNEEKALQESLLIKMRTQAAEVLKTKQLLDDCETKNRALTDQIQQLFEQNESNGSELVKVKRELEEVQKEKRLLEVQVKGLDEEVEKLQMEVKERCKDSTEGLELHGKLLEQIKGKNGEIRIEQQKRKEVIDAFKKLKSQYNYLCSKAGLTSENMIHGSISSPIINKDQLVSDQNIFNSPVMDTKSPTSPMLASEASNHNTNQQNLNDKKETKIKIIHSSSSSSPIVAQPESSSKKTNSLSGSKRPASHWRDTRPAKNRNGPDPHDDFLDTPLENIKEDLKKGVKEETIHQLPAPAPKDMNIDSTTDDETQDLNADPGPGPGPQGTEKKSFKYVEPVRKKAERANLKGVECKQCKKFYDAVLPDDNNNNKQNLRCEHHEGVSRHRYRFAPPSTPEGFWNIGFESEM